MRDENGGTKWPGRDESPRAWFPYVNIPLNITHTFWNRNFKQGVGGI